MYRDAFRLLLIVLYLGFAILLPHRHASADSPPTYPVPHTLPAYLAADLALLDAPLGFTVNTLTHCYPVILPGVFLGCEDRTYLPDDDASYAGLVWIDGIPSLSTGP